MEDIWTSQCEECRFSWARFSFGESEPEATGCDLGGKMTLEQNALADIGDCPCFEPW